jgi:hypothetical protein
MHAIGSLIRVFNPILVNALFHINPELVANMSSEPHILHEQYLSVKYDVFCLPAACNSLIPTLILAIGNAEMAPMKWCQHLLG